MEHGIKLFKKSWNCHGIEPPEPLYLRYIYGAANGCFQKGYLCDNLCSLAVLSLLPVMTCSHSRIAENIEKNNSLMDNSKGNFGCHIILAVASRAGNKHCNLSFLFFTRDMISWEAFACFSRPRPPVTVEEQHKRLWPEAESKRLTNNKYRNFDMLNSKVAVFSDCGNDQASHPWTMEVSHALEKSFKASECG